MIRHRMERRRWAVTVYYRVDGGAPRTFFGEPEAATAIDAALIARRALTDKVGPDPPEGAVLDVSGLSVVDIGDRNTPATPASTPTPATEG